VESLWKTCGKLVENLWKTCGKKKRTCGKKTTFKRAVENLDTFPQTFHRQPTALTPSTRGYKPFFHKFHRLYYYYFKYLILKKIRKRRTA